MARKPDMPCSVCGRLMHRTKGSLPPGLATCHPCRRAARPEPDGGNEACLLCSKSLSDVQRRQGNKFCGSACSYRFARLREESVGVQDPPSRRFRRMGTCRPSDREGDGWITYQGPGRRQKLSVHVYTDGSPTMVSCPGCAFPAPLDAVSFDFAWCEHCGFRTALDERFVVTTHGTPSGARGRSQVASPERGPQEAPGVP